MTFFFGGWDARCKRENISENVGGDWGCERKEMDIGI